MRRLWASDLPPTPPRRRRLPKLCGMVARSRAAATPRAPASPQAALQAHALELLSSLGAVRARRMFGGVGLFLDEPMVALIAGEVLYLKADALAQPAFATAGCQPFSYATKDGQRQITSYWSAPDEAMESPAQMRPWALLALDSALRAAAARRTAAPRRPQASRRQPAAKTPAPGRSGTRDSSTAGAGTAPARKAKSPKAG
jgi:DNA transformation protein